MSSSKVVYLCQNCGADSPKWVGKCGVCNAWNSYVEQVVDVQKNKSRPASLTRVKDPVPILLSDISQTQTQRLSSGQKALDLLLGGGIVPGSLILLGGEPGVGKSTLLLQLLTGDRKSLYVSGEESPEQIKLRVERLGVKAAQSYLLAETALDKIMTHVRKLIPEILVIDSIQTLYMADVLGSAGSLTQIRECTAQLMQYAKSYAVPIFLVGHINKEGALAGPKVLEHMVDVVLQFEGDPDQMYRLLRVHKNRFGPTHELGIYQMETKGLIEVKNPNFLLFSSPTEIPPTGISVGAVLEGNRVLLVEVQALVSPATYGTVQRVSTGFDAKRLNMLIALLEKKVGVALRTQDVFLNITGGLKVSDPAMDLPVCLSVLSSLYDKPLPHGTLCVAELGLSGELRPIARIDKRLGEAQKLGFTQALIPEAPKGQSPKVEVHNINCLSHKYLAKLVQELWQ
ncbi:MAG: DNA repair protein RadA [Cytophagales bacterium]|nr:DNA repair protein RadA [Cytophagales bacterium]